MVYTCGFSDSRVTRNGEGHYIGSKDLIRYQGAIYHSTTRGNHRNDMFRDGEDYQVYLNILKEALERLTEYYTAIV